jgi:IS4 transposase
VQYSGNEHGLVRGIGLVSCIYVNPELGQCWLIDYRIYDKAGDGYSKLEHVEAMLRGVVEFKQQPFRTVLMDSWYASQKLMAVIDELEKIYYCPLKCNRLVDDSGGQAPYRRLDSLEWSDDEIERGKLIKIRGFPADKKVKLFRVTVSSHRTDFVVTNDMTQDSTQATTDICGVRWKIEVVHRELKQLTGIESCQCRKGRIQRNHIHCALLVWDFLRRQAREQSVSLYQIAYQPLSDFLRQQLAHPSLAFSLA